MSVTIKDIARIAGVSRGTVDRVINNRGSVNPATEEKIRKIADSLNYSPNLTGKNLAVNKKHLRLGFVLIRSAISPFYIDLETGISDRIKKYEHYGVNIIIRSTLEVDAEHQLQKIDELVEEGIDGLAIIPVNDPKVADRLKEISDSGIPVITVNSDLMDCGRIAYVGSDYYKAGRIAAGLLQLICQGTANIGLMIDNDNIPCVNGRIDGFVSCLKECYPNMQIAGTISDIDSSSESHQRLICFLKDHPNLTALYIPSTGVIETCNVIQELGLAGTLKIICYDISDEIRELLRAGIISAVITQEPFVQGSQPLDVLVDLLGNNIQPQKVMYYTTTEILLKESFDN